MRRLINTRSSAAVIAFCSLFCGFPAGAIGGDTVEDAARRAENAIAGLDVAPGLEATLFASEPMLLSPTNIDVDHRGRVWVCEVVNYRRRNGTRPEGDRILILEDTDGDGRADKSTVFHQGRDIDTAMGICVLGNRVIVSASPNIFVFTDTDGDDKADKKELLFSKTGNPQHDHSAHAFLFGPDGMLYWNFGNEGKAVHDAQGKPVVDLAGNIVIDNGQPYREGMIFRCNLTGGDFEVLGNNFRNNYEVTVDSFGGLWQSDNDDDGNRGVRINAILEYGNYGYRDEMTGAGWRTPRTNLEKEVPLQHWHLNDPGVVPNLLQTGGGSPTGITVYEGNLLPDVFRNQLIHCDAGPNVVRAYPVKEEGAGYFATSVNILQGARDQWFRPSDVCVAPDGSLIVADWYDPGVGGHRMGDIDKGRLFRVAPPNSPYKSPQFDLKTPAGAVEALKSPNGATRYLAWTALHEMQTAAEPALKEMYERDKNPRFRARALWLLGNINDKGAEYVDAALRDDDPNIRITGLRLARRLKLDVIPLVKQLVHDLSPFVRRECAIALRHNPSAAMPALWAELATQYDGHDRWALEALGIAADRRWDDCLDAWLAQVGEKWKESAGRDIIWRSRATKTPRMLASLVVDPATSDDEIPRIFRAFDFLDDAAKQQPLEQLTLRTTNLRRERDQFVAREGLLRLKATNLSDNPDRERVLSQVLDHSRGTEAFLELVRKYDVRTQNEQLMALAQEKPDQDLGVQAIRILLSRKNFAEIEHGIAQPEVPLAIKTVQALGHAQDSAVLDLLWKVADDAKRPVELRREAVRGLSHYKQAAMKLLDRAEQGELEAALRDVTVASLQPASWDDVKQRALRIFPLPPSRNSKPLPPLNDLVSRQGDPARGKALFGTTGTCAKCHVVDGAGKQVGPELSEIGDKLSRLAFYESIVYPSAGISHNYETHVALLRDGTTVTGIVTSRTPESVTLKDAEAIERTIPLANIEELHKQDVSLMPADLQKTLVEEELVDIVEYLATLKKQNKGAGK